MLTATVKAPRVTSTMSERPEGEVGVAEEGGVVAERHGHDGGERHAEASACGTGAPSAPTRASSGDGVGRRRRW